MVWEMKRCHTRSKPLYSDRLTSLPDEALDHIVSLLPTKDVAVLQLSSKRLGHVFSSIKSIDLDAFPAGPAHHCPLLIDARFPLFKSFITKVLLQRVDCLTRFRLRFGGDKITLRRDKVNGHKCYITCLPNLELGRINLWLSYPLAHSGLRDLELTFHLSNPDECKLPPQLFDFPSLESFKVDANFEVDSADYPLICLPKLKLMNIHSVLFSDADFVTRLVSSCPALEDLCITHCVWVTSIRMTITSHSLRRMVFYLVKVEDVGEDGDEENDERTELVTIDTPNLEHLSYADELAFRYSITHMNAIVEADLRTDERLFNGVETSAQSQLSLLSAFTKVQHLSLNTGFLEAMTFRLAKLEKHLPVFCNLKTLKLEPGESEDCRWDFVLPFILNSSPLLETLIFPKGPFANPVGPSKDIMRSRKKQADLEAEGWRTITLPCLTHLKRIEFGRCFALDRELNLINFFLGKAPGLKEVVLCLYTYDYPGYAKPSLEEFVSKLEELPRASNSCSFIMQ